MQPSLLVLTSLKLIQQVQQRSLLQQKLRLRQQLLRARLRQQQQTMQLIQQLLQQEKQLPAQHQQRTTRLLLLQALGSKLLQRRKERALTTFLTLTPLTVKM